MSPSREPGGTSLLEMNSGGGQDWRQSGGREGQEEKRSPGQSLRLPLRAIQVLRIPVFRTASGQVPTYEYFTLRRYRAYLGGISQSPINRSINQSISQSVNFSLSHKLPQVSGALFSAAYVCITRSKENEAPISIPTFTFPASLIVPARIPCLPHPFSLPTSFPTPRTSGSQVSRSPPSRERHPHLTRP